MTDTDTLAQFLMEARSKVWAESASAPWTPRHDLHVAQELLRRGVVVLPPDHPMRTGEPSVAMVQAALGSILQEEYLGNGPTVEMQRALCAALAVLRP